MGIFGIYVLVCTFLLFVYYIVNIWLDLRGKKDVSKDETETIFTGDYVDTESSTDVKELDGGGYSLSSPDDDDSDNIETPLAVGLGGGDDVSPSQEVEPSSVVTSEENGDDSEPDSEPSEFEIAKKVHDELTYVERSYEEQLNSRELLVQLACPINHKTHIYRRRSVY